MSQEKSNIALLNAAYKHWNDTKGGNIGEWLAMMDDNIKFGTLAEGAGPMIFDHCRNAKAGVEAYLQALLEHLEMIHYTVDEYIVQGERIVTVGSVAWRNRATDKLVESPIVNVIRMKDGRISEYFEYYDTAKALAAFVPDGG